MILSPKPSFFEGKRGLSSHSRCFNHSLIRRCALEHCECRGKRSFARRVLDQPSDFEFPFLCVSSLGFDDNKVVLGTRKDAEQDFISYLKNNGLRYLIPTD